jgi:hypothetical protein
MKTHHLIIAVLRTFFRAFGSGPYDRGQGALAALLPCLLANIALAAPINYIQGHYETSLLPRTKMTVVYTEAQNAGDLNVVIVGWRNPDSLVQDLSVTDSMGNHYPHSRGYHIADGPVTSDNGDGTLSESIYFCANILPAAPRANTVTVTFTGAATAPDIRILEYSGIDTKAFPVLVATSSSGNSDWSRSGRFIIFTAPVLMVAANVSGPLTSGPTSGFIQRLLTKPYGDIAEDRVMSAFTTNNRFNAGASLTQAGPWLMMMAIFQGADVPTSSIAHSPMVSTPAFVQGTSIALQSPQPEVSLAYPKAQAEGDSNIVIVGQRWTESTTESGPPSDTQGNRYQLAAAPAVVEGSVSLTQAIYYAKDIAPAPAGSNRVTMKFNRVAIYPDIRILEYSGIDPMNPVDAIATDQQWHSGKARQRHLDDRSGARDGRWPPEPERGRTDPKSDRSLIVR